MRSKKFNILINLVKFLLIFLIIVPVWAANESLKHNLQNFLTQAVINSSVTPGAVLYVESPKLGVMLFAAGYSDKEQQTPMTIHNNFRLASISKTFLSVTILKMYDDHLINLNDTIDTYLPDTVDLERLPNGNQITVRQLMQMRSGLPNYTDTDKYYEFIESHQSHTWSPLDGLQMVYDTEQDFDPGSDYEYSNTNYLLLQLIVENISHEDYAVAMRQYIFEPLQMHHTFVEVHEPQDQGINGLMTHGYEEDDNKLEDVTTYNDGFGSADGGVISTATDLATFVKALLQTKTLLSKDALAAMLTPLGPDKYGLGIYQETVDDEVAWTHNGASSGFGTQYYYFPSRQLIIIILTNSYSSDIFDDLAEKVMQEIKANENSSIN